MKSRILVVDDDELTRLHLQSLLELDEHEVLSAPDVKTALETIRTTSIQLLITDLRLPGQGGLELLERVREERMPFGVVVVTAYGDTEVAIEAMRAGADDFVSKPFEPEQFRLLVERTIARRRLKDEVEQLRLQMSEDYSFHNIVSKSPRMKRVFDLIQQVGPLGSTVLIHGETGTGKELVAQAIHAASNRSGEPWVAVNCAALNDSLLESEIFGHEKGAFTGADRQRKGRFELAHGGTLFLDEIGEISPAMQSKMLRVLQSGRFERVGGTETLEVDVRIVAASNKRLEDEVNAGRFRRDLYFRLNVVRIDLPPLRERKEDIPLLAAHFLGRLSHRSTPPVTEIDPEAMGTLMAYHWPGNVRQLENAIKAAVALADGSVIHRSNLPEAIAPGAEGAHGAMLDLDRPLREVTEDLIARVEREYFEALLEQFGGNVAQCARHSGLSRRCVTMKLQKYELDRRLYKRIGAAVADED